MALLTVPEQHEKIQLAIDVAKSGDEIFIKPGGVYKETLSFIDKHNISITAIPGTVINDGTTIGGTGLNIVGNNIVVSGLQFLNFTTGISVVGNNNLLKEIVSSFNIRTGLLINGNENVLINSQSTNNQISSVNISGFNNVLKNNRFVENKKTAIASNHKVCIGNIFINNVLALNIEHGINIFASDSKDNILYQNLIDGSYYGVSSYGDSTAIIENTIQNTTTGIFTQSDENLIINNSLSNNKTGMNLFTSCTEISNNILQGGSNNGISIFGNNNCIYKNVIWKYQDIALLINGNYNKENSNILENNFKNILINSIANSDAYSAQPVSSFLRNINQNNCNFKEMLNIFRHNQRRPR